MQGCATRSATGISKDSGRAVTGVSIFTVFVVDESRFERDPWKSGGSSGGSLMTRVRRPGSGFRIAAQKPSNTGSYTGLKGTELSCARRRAAVVEIRGLFVVVGVWLGG